MGDDHAAHLELVDQLVYDGHAWTPHAEGGGPIGALVVTPGEVTLSASPGQHRWACRRPGALRDVGER